MARGPRKPGCKEENHFVEDSTMMDVEVGLEVWEEKKWDVY